MSVCLIGIVSLGDLLYGRVLSKHTKLSFDISSVEKAELKMWGWIIAARMAMRHCGVPSLKTDLFSITYIKCPVHPGLPFFHTVPVTKLIHMIIERGVNEGKMLLTFECHSLLLPAARRLLRDKAAPLQKTPRFYENGFPKSLIIVDALSCI